MGIVKSGHDGTTKNEFYVGDGTDGYKYIYAAISITPNPAIRYNADSFRWEYSSDGSAYHILSGSAGDLPIGTTYQLLQYVAGNWSAVNGIILPTGDTRTIKLQDNGSGSGDTLNIISAHGSIGGDGGSLNLYAGNSDASGIPGDLTINAGDGYSVVNGGNVFINGGFADSGDGGYIKLSGGVSDSGVDGDIFLTNRTFIGSQVFVNSEYLTALGTFDNGFIGITSTLDINKGVALVHISNDNVSTELSYIKSRGSPSSLSTIFNGDSLGKIAFSGYDGVNILNTVKIEAVSNGAISLGNVPSDLKIMVGNDDNPPVSVLIANVDDNYSKITFRSGLYFAPDIRDWEIKIEDSTDGTGDSLYIYSGYGSSTNGDLYLYRGNQLFVGLDQTDGPTFYKSYIRFNKNIITPTITQLTRNTTSTNGYALTVQAQSEINTGSNGGNLNLKSGSGAVSNGNIYLFNGGSAIVLQMDSSSLKFYNTVSSPIIGQVDESGSSITCDTLTVQAQKGAGATNIGGQLTLAGGDGTGVNSSGGCVLVRGGTQNSSGDYGNVAFHALPASWQSGEKIIFVGDCETSPADVPANGGFLYSDGGAGKWRGSGGTTSTFGPAEPHCKKCGRDFGVSWDNEYTKEKLSVCMWCLVETLENAGIDLSSFIVK